MDIRGFLRGHRTTVAFAVLVSMSVVSLLFSAGLSGEPGGVGSSALGALQRSVHAIGGFFSETVDSVRQLGQLREDYDALLERVRSAELLEHDIEELRLENERLRSVLEFSDNRTYRHVAARVIGRDPQHVFSTIAINRGSRHGVERDMPVVAVQDGMEALVGRVVEVQALTARVLPVSAPEAYVAAMLEVSRYQGLAAGTGASRTGLVLRHVSLQAREAVSVGSTVVTSGLSSVYPQGIRIGRVAAVRSHPYEASLEIEVTPFIDFSRLEYLYVVESEEHHL